MVGVGVAGLGRGRGRGTVRMGPWACSPTRARCACLVSCFGLNIFSRTKGALYGGAAEGRAYIEGLLCGRGLGHRGGGERGLLTYITLLRYYIYLT